MKIINSPMNQKLISKLKREILKDTQSILDTAEFFPETLSITSSLTKLLPTFAKPKVVFTDLAAKKMKALVDKCPTEIGWHGVVERGPKNLFIIKDILVYPQIAAPGTVVADEDQYPVWLYDFPDQVFDNIRMQGHSHVNFAVSPSGVDRTYYGKLTEQVKDYYIFIIVNKHAKVWIEIQDVANGIIYDASDITISNLDDPILKWTNKMLKTQLQKPAPVVVKPVVVYDHLENEFSSTQAELAYIRNLKGYQGVRI